MELKTFKRLLPIYAKMGKLYDDFNDIGVELEPISPIIAELALCFMDFFQVPQEKDLPYDHPEYRTTFRRDYLYDILANLDAENLNDIEIQRIYNEFNQWKKLQ